MKSRRSRFGIAAVACILEFRHSKDAKAGCIFFLAILSLLAMGITGCSTRPATQAHDTRINAGPSDDSVGEFLDLIEFDDLWSRFMSAEKGEVQNKFAQIRGKSCTTPESSTLCDEFMNKAMSIIDETYSLERTKSVLRETIRRSFSQNDMDALNVFYRTQSGKTIVAEMKRAIRPFIEERKVRREVIGQDSEHDRPIQPGYVFYVITEAVDSHELPQFYGKDIDEDIEKRLPNARNIYDSEIEPLQADGRARLRELVTDYQAKLKAVPAL